MTFVVPRNHVPFRDEWTAWRWAGLRGTGFPVSLVQRLNFPDCAAAADRLATAQAQVRQVQNDACDLLRASLDELGRGEAQKSQRKLLLKALEKLKKGKLHARLDEALDAQARQALDAASEELKAAEEAFEQAFDQAILEQSRALRGIAADKRFQEAILWQNHHAYKTAVLKLLSSEPGDTSSSQRQKEELVAKYVQRYAVKNDTIGFFGPVGWVHWVEDEDCIASIRPSEDFLADRSVYFEGWAVVALARVLMKFPGTLRWLKPQLLPMHTVDEEGRLSHPLGLTLQVDDDQIMLLEAMDGTRSAFQLCTDLAADPNCSYANREEVRQQLLHFYRERCVAWEFVLPAGPFALDALRRQVEEFGEEPLRQQSLGLIDQFEQLRDKIERAAGDPDQLEKVIHELNVGFERLTGEAPARRAGEDYAARTLTYEDCVRGGHIDMGPKVLQEISQPLSLILYSIRWLTHEVANALRQVVDVVLRDLALFHGDEVPVLSFWPKIVGELNDEAIQAFSQDVVKEFQRRWQDILDLQTNDPAEEIRRSSAELRAKVEAAFPADGPGWAGARYLSPDVMLAAESAEALERGDFHVVLGELHIAYNSLSVWLFGAQHPELEAVEELLENDLQEGKIHLEAPNAENYIARFGPILIPKRDRIVASAAKVSDIPPEQRLEPEDLIVIKNEDGVRVRSVVDDEIDFDITDALSNFLTYGIVSRCHILGAADHWPRVWLDNMVAHRQSWVFEGRELGFVDASTPAERFAGARAWWLDRGLPQRVFFRVATELKPIYVDFSSPIYVELMCKAIRATLRKGEDTKVKVSEMAPDLHQAWLPDSSGERYTSELRIILTDRAGYDTPSGA